jgi:hypothetical protein
VVETGDMDGLGGMDGMDEWDGVDGRDGMSGMEWTEGMEGKSEEVRTGVESGMEGKGAEEWKNGKGDAEASKVKVRKRARCTEVLQEQEDSKSLSESSSLLVTSLTEDEIRRELDCETGTPEEYEADEKQMSEEAFDLSQKLFFLNPEVCLLEEPSQTPIGEEDDRRGGNVFARREQGGGNGTSGMGKRTTNGAGDTVCDSTGTGGVGQHGLPSVDVRNQRNENREDRSTAEAVFGRVGENLRRQGIYGGGTDGEVDRSCEGAGGTEESQKNAGIPDGRKEDGSSAENCD